MPVIKETKIHAKDVYEGENLATIAQKWLRRRSEPETSNASFRIEETRAGPAFKMVDDRSNEMLKVP